ncbi:DUF6798 domain-containing protein [Hoeflea prorocentri]|uniref:DUF6798 domain-containing protein n=1 Tax=Hoeflea prorocentri TaxID=1922333 RepID=A0A9X3UFM4_9HYPH|nr:DUF6798 domain-containing protein [Hoeflea prorocentri]MCY6380005.1 hypothetical protein [Hoeflea prorocentri]MDA5397805.1 hypothetical protein [Hoeflea prorocentri]
MNMASGSGAGSGLTVFVVCAFVLAAAMLPSQWSGNEIHYFDLALRQVRPDLFGADHSVFDSSNARFLSFWIIGTLIDALGFEYTKILLGFLGIGLYAFALAVLARALDLGPIAMAAALVVFLAQQSLLGREWLFLTIEAKVFAYACAMGAIALGVRGRWKAAIVVSAIGTVFHFLVGGFWGAAILLFHALSLRDWRQTLSLLGLFVVLISPMVALVAFERLGAVVDPTGLDLSLTEIYSEYRNPHHVSPFAGGAVGFVLGWLPGLIVHAALAAAIFFMRKDFGRYAAFALWVAGLNVYIVFAVLVAFLDQNTHLFAPFYIFRPSGLIFLLSLLLIVKRVFLAIRLETYRRIRLPIFLVAVALVLPDITRNALRLAVSGPIGQRLEASLRGAERDAFEWLRENTASEDVVLIQPPMGDGNVHQEQQPFPAALERLTPAAYYVNFKFVPTAPADLAEWYRRVKHRRAIFDGDCDMLRVVAPDILIVRRSAASPPLQDCAEPVYDNERYVFLRPI